MARIAKRLLSGIILAILLSACGVQTGSTPTLSSVKTPTEEETASPPARLSLTQTATPPPQPTETFQPFLPQKLEVLSNENKDQVTQIAQWGKGAVHQIALSPDNTILASATSLGIYVHRADDLEETAFAASTSPVLTLAFSPTEDLLASGLSNGKVQVWKAGECASKSGICLTLIKTADVSIHPIESVAFSPDGEILAATSLPHQVFLWKTECLASSPDCNAPTTIIESDISFPSMLAFSPDGATLAIGFYNGSIELHEAASCNSEGMNICGSLITTLSKHKGRVTNLAFSPNGALLASTAGDVPVRIWRLNISTNTVSLEHKGGAKSIVFSPDSKRLFVATGDKLVRAWQISDYSILGNLTGYEAAVNSLAISADGKRLFTSSLDGAIRTWNTEQRKIDGENKRAYSAPIRSFALSKDGENIAVAEDNYLVRTYSISDCLNTGKQCNAPIQQAAGHTDEIQALGYLSGDSALVTGSLDMTLRVWPLQACPADNIACLKADTTIKFRRASVLDLAVSPPDSTISVAGSDGATRIFSPRQEKAIKEIDNSPKTTWSTIISPDGKITASGYGDGSIDLWQTEQCTVQPEYCLIKLASLKGQEGPISSLAISPDNQWLASASWDRSIRFWDIDKCISNPGGCRPTAEYKNHSAGGNSLSFSPDGTLLASASDDNTVILWPVEDCTTKSNQCNEKVLTGHTAPVTRVNFSPDGKMLVSGSKDGSLRFWGIKD